MRDCKQEENKLRMKRFHLIFILIIIFTVLPTMGLYAGIPTNDAFPDGGIKAKVVDVISPVELMISEGGSEYKVRLLNLHIPEKKKSLVELAKKEVERYVLGDTVLVVYDEMKLNDENTPIVLIYYAENKYLLNADLVKKGYAFYQHFYPCQIKKELLDAQKEAKAYEVGMWRSDDASSADGRYVSDNVEVLLDENSRQKSSIREQKSKIAEQEMIIDELIYIIESLVVNGEATEDLKDKLNGIRTTEEEQQQKNQNKSEGYEEILDEVRDRELDDDYLDDEIIRVEEIDIDELNYEKIKNKMQKKIDEINEKLETSKDPEEIDKLLQERDKLWAELENIEEIEMIEKKFEQVDDSVYSKEDIEKYTEDILETMTIEEDLEDVEGFIRNNDKIVEDLETYIEETPDVDEDLIKEELEGIDKYIDSDNNKDEAENKKLPDYKENIDEIIKDDSFVDINKFIYDENTGIEKDDNAEIVLNWANTAFSFDTAELSEGIAYFNKTYDINFYKLLMGYEYSLTDDDSLIFDNSTRLSGLSANFKNFVETGNNFLLLVEGDYSAYDIVETDRENNEAYYKSDWYISVYKYNDETLVLGTDKTIKAFIHYIGLLKEDSLDVFNSLLIKSPIYKTIATQDNIDISKSNNWIFIDNTEKKLFDADIVSTERFLPKGIGTLFFDYAYSGNKNNVRIELGSFTSDARIKLEGLLNNWMGIMSLFSLKSLHASILLDSIEIESKPDKLLINAEFSDEDFTSFLKDISKQ